MRKVYVAVAAIAAMSSVFVACTKELDTPAGTTVVEGQAGRIVFNVKTGGGVLFTKNVVSEDCAIHSLSVFLFDALGNRVQGVRQNYSAAEITDGKISVSLPSDLMDKTGFKAYLVANTTWGDLNIETESALTDCKATRTHAEVSTDGIVMVSAPMLLNTTAPVVSLDASMKRSMSSLFVKVNPVDVNGTMVNAGDFTYKVKGVRVDGGYMFKDEVCAGEVTSATWTPKANTNAEELLGYMYQANGFEVEITPSADKPVLGSASRTVVVAADKAMKRNKKYVLNVLPKVSESGTIDFSVTVQDWDATEGGLNVDWVERVTLASYFPSLAVTKDGEGLRVSGLCDANGRKSDLGLVKAYFSEEGCVIKDITLEGLSQGESSGLYVKNGRLVSPAGIPLLEDTKGEMVVTTEKEGVLATQKFPVVIDGAFVRPKKGANFSKGDSFGSVRLEERAGVIYGVYTPKPGITTGTYYISCPLVSIFEVVDSYDIEYTNVVTCELYDNIELLGAAVGSVGVSVSYNTVGGNHFQVNTVSSGISTGYFEVLLTLADRDTGEKFRRRVLCHVDFK